MRSQLLTLSLLLTACDPAASEGPASEAPTPTSATQKKVEREPEPPAGTLEHKLWQKAGKFATDMRPSAPAFGGELEIVLEDGREIRASKAVADAHPNGAAPWGWEDYVGKLERLTDAIIDAEERDRFVNLAARLQEQGGDGDVVG